MGTLYIVATPIGNLEDITIRAIKTLFSVDAILCEDTRRTGNLLNEIIKRYGEQFDIEQTQSPKLISYYDEIEEKRLPEVIALLEQGKHLALVSDAGTPLIADPGYRLIRACIKHAIPVTGTPGPSALITALTLSGLAPDKFMFLGYPPEKQSHRIKLFENLQSMRQYMDTTYLFYCAPHKFAQTLNDMKEIFGDIEITVARELTKIHEELWRGKINDIQKSHPTPIGELVILFTITIR